MLVLNQFGVSLGFVLVGVVLCVRTLSQQGLYLVGGTAVDRLRPQSTIISGCVLLIVGFGLFATTTNLVCIPAGTVPTGVAGTIFSLRKSGYQCQETSQSSSSSTNRGAGRGTVLMIDYAMLATALVAHATHIALTAADSTHCGDA